MSRKLIITVALAGAHCALAAAETNAISGAYVSPMFTAVRADDARTVDDDPAFTLSGGFRLLPKWNLEGNVFRGSFDGVGGDDLDMDGVGINALRLFRYERNVRPFVLIGAGSLRKDRNLTADARDTYGDAGAGVMVAFRRAEQTGSALALRAELRARHDDASEGGRVDRLLSVGLQYAFGRRTEPAPAAPQPEPAPAPTAPVDSDRDGVPDALDRCPGTPAASNVDAEGCEPDIDRDGVVNTADRCPDTQPGVRVDARGCELRDEIRLPRVAFAFNSAELLPEAFVTLDEATVTLRMNPDLRIEVAGHTDDVGSDAYNLELSQRRAEAVRRYLVEHGVTNTMTARGIGEREPVADNATEQGRAQNRRVVLRILSR